MNILMKKMYRKQKKDDKPQQSYMLHNDATWLWIRSVVGQQNSDVWLNAKQAGLNECA